MYKVEIEFPFRMTACQSKEKLLGHSLKSVFFSDWGISV